MAATPRPDRLVLLDTDVLSHLLRNTGELSERYRELLSGHDMAVTFITVGEIYSGLYKRELSGRVARFETRLRQELLLIPFSLDVCRAYGRLVFERTPHGSQRLMGAPTTAG